MQLHVLALSASPRQGVQRKNVRLSPNASQCTHCHDEVVRPDTKGCTSWRERASNLSVPLNMGMAPCNLEWKRRYAPLDGASETKGRLYLRRVGVQRRGTAPLAGVIDKRAAAGPLVRQPRRRKKQSASPIYYPQASARKKNERTKSFLRAHLRRALFLSPGTARAGK